jgi:hypothetical protein
MNSQLLDLRVKFIQAGLDLVNAHLEVPIENEVEKQIQKYPAADLSGAGTGVGRK